MDFLHWQQTDKNQFAVFIRDLTKNLNNVKHMVQDSIVTPSKPKYGKKNKKPVKKKKILLLNNKLNSDLKKILKKIYLNWIIY